MNEHFYFDALRVTLVAVACISTTYIALFGNHMINYVVLAVRALIKGERT